MLSLYGYQGSRDIYATLSLKTVGTYKILFNFFHFPENILTLTFGKRRTDYKENRGVFSLRYSMIATRHEL